SRKTERAASAQLSQRERNKGDHGFSGAAEIHAQSTPRIYFQYPGAARPVGERRKHQRRRHTMNPIERASGGSGLNRRSFFASAGAVVLGGLAPHATWAKTTNEDGTGMQREIFTGNGEWTYRIVSGWGALP